MTKRVWVPADAMDDASGTQYVIRHSGQVIDPANLDPAMVERAARSMYERGFWSVPWEEAWVENIESYTADALATLVDALTVEGDSELPAVRDFVGVDPDFTGELSTDEYMRKLRNG